MREMIIIGGGIAGMSAGIYAARSALNPLILIGPIQGGALTQSHEIENYPGFVDSIPCFQLTDTIEKQARRLGTEFQQETVKNIEKISGGYKINTLSGKSLEAKTIILATGTKPRNLDVPGMKDFYGKGVSSCAVCDGFFYKGKKVAVIGGGNTALYEALYLAKICEKVTIVHRGAELTAEKITQELVKKVKNIEIIYESELYALHGENVLTKAEIRHNQTQKKQFLDVDGLFVAIGVLPNTDFLKGFIDLNPWGYVETTGKSTATNHPGIFVAGDMIADVFQQVVIAAGSGATAALEAEHYLHNM
ncbi:MAG: FAD-dependent oxidoreductase [Alphaproteobacteria bacterium]|nr:FAD-dependent oxidoreductase [Alphaproteobacteria bacterium]